MNITAADTAWLISRCQEQGMRIERPQYDPNAPDAWAIKSRLKRAEKRNSRFKEMFAREKEHGCELISGSLRGFKCPDKLLSSSAAPTSHIQSGGDARNQSDHRAAGGDY